LLLHTLLTRLDTVEAVGTRKDILLGIQYICLGRMNSDNTNNVSVVDILNIVGYTGFSHNTYSEINPN
jgi:hypothetical protein